MTSLLTLPSSPTVTLTMTSPPPKPSALVRRLPSSPAVTSAGAAGLPSPNATMGSALGSWPIPTSATQRRAALVASLTAVEVMVAPLRAWKAPPLMASMPTNCSAKAGSLARAPKLAVSAKFRSPTTQPVTRPSVPTPRVTATSPA